MENRYLPGMLYWEKAGQTVWRMYDQLLEIKVLAFRAKEGQQEQLYQMARKLERLNLLDEHFVKILAVKKINEEWRREKTADTGGSCSERFTGNRGNA